MRKNKFFTPLIFSGLGIFSASLIVYITSRFVPDFAEWWTRYPSHYIRAALAFITNHIPFSVAEMIIIILIPCAVIYVIVTNRFIKEDKSEDFYRFVKPLVMVILLLLSSFFGVFGPCYFRYGLDKNLELEKQAVSPEELKETALWLLAEIDKTGIAAGKEGATYLSDSYEETVNAVKAAYREYCDENDFIGWFESKPKLIALSPVMTYTHISGIYSFFTGEANINYNYPDFVLPFTLAHEMAHQRGIAREDEANFVAFQVCIGSDNEYVRYSGYFNILQYVLSALSKADKAAYSEVVSENMSDTVKSELRAYSEFFKKYEKSTASQVVGSINNSYLTSQGQTAGSKSYGLVVDLAVAYYKTLSIE